MRKRISLKTRRLDLSVEAFREHYEKRHVPLGLRFIDRFQWRRYVRNHVLKCTGHPIGFDCFTEFWVDASADDEALASFIASPEFRVLDEDDRRFLDVTRRFSCEMHDRRLHVASGAGAGMAKWVLVASGTSRSAEAFGRVAQEIVSALGDRVESATLDRVIGEASPNAPFDTLLAIELIDRDPIGIELESLPGTHHSLLLVDPVETLPELLFPAGRPAAMPEHEAELAEG